MSESKETTSKSRETIRFNRHKNQVYMNQSNLPVSFPPLDQIKEIILVDHNNRPYVYKLLKNSESDSDALEDAIGCEDLSVDLDEIKEIFMMLNDDQRNILMHIYYVYKNNKRNEVLQNDLPVDNPKIILQGPAGSGKSTIINLIEKLITWEENKTSETPEKIKVLKCAFTGKAASNIDGVTLNHMFSIPIYNTRRVGKKSITSKKELLENCIFFICDEISLVGQKLMDSVDMRLKIIFENDKLYGDRFVLLVGDLHQLDPVGQKPVYPNSQLWTCCEFYELNKIMRQQDENFINALNNFRDFKMTEADINLLRSRCISKEDIDEIPDSVIHLFNLNPDVNAFNNEKLNKSNGEEVTVNSIEDKEEWEPANLRVKIGIRYMIIKNMNVHDSLANGTTGIVKGFGYDKNGCVDIIWMDFHSNKIGKNTRTDYFKKHSKPGFENWVPIHRSSVVVKLKADPKVSRTVGNMFPLKAAEAITVHKSQGQTYHEGVCVHITENSKDKLRFDRSLQYVALTRATRIEDLYICGTLDFSATNNKKLIRTVNELKRLRTEKKVKLAYETFEDRRGDVIMFLNTGSTFNDQYQFITTDKWYSNGSLLIFTETNTVGSDEIKIPNFEIAFRSDCNSAKRSGGGMMCYKEISKTVEVIASNEETEYYSALLLYEKLLHILIFVKKDLNKVDNEKKYVEDMLNHTNDKRCIYFFANFKTNISGSCHGFINDDALYIQNIAGIRKGDIGYYEYIPSFHRPVYVKLPPSVKSNESFVQPGNDNEDDKSYQENTQETMEVE